VAKFDHSATRKKERKKKGPVTCTKHAFGKNMTQSHRHIWGEKNLMKLSYLDQRFLHVNLYVYRLGELKFVFELFSLTFSQIWLSPLVNGCQSTHLTKLKRKTLLYRS
jgi:hypothetical protein